MDFSALLIFVPACFALNLAPGPNNLLSISNSAHYGFLRSCLAGMGRLMAFSLMILMASVGLTAIILTSETVFTAIKLVGAAYLLYLGLQLWLGNPSKNRTDGTLAEDNLLLLMRREFVVAAGNPKAILIFTAFLPQFVSQDKPAGIQFLQLGGMFLILEWVAIAIYAYLGQHLQRWLTGTSTIRIFNRICGSLLAMAGVALLVVPKVH